MAQQASINKRSGDEYYTKRETVEKLIDIYDDIFQKYTYIWIPFNSQGKPIHQVFVEKYGEEKILLTPDNFYNEELGVNDFWKFENDEKFLNKIQFNKTLVFDNIPFSLSTKIIRRLIHHCIDYIVFSDSMTGLNKVNSLRCGYHILGRVPFDNCDPKKRINIGLFSNLFDHIKYVFGVGTDKVDQHGIANWSDKVNIEKYRDERNGEIASAELINVCARGYVFYLNKIDFTKKVKKFGGGITYDFN